MNARLEPGDTAPNFSLPADAQRTLSLHDYRGRKIVLFFYPRDDTSDCTREAKDFSGLKASFDQADASIIGISADSVASHEKFKAKHALDVDLASDEDADVLLDYGIWVDKNMYGRKFKGIERTTLLIDRKGKIAQIWRKVKVPGHADDVLKAVKNLD
ncbi:MAG: peroxiredoxin [Aestuariivirgaceae bacterium]